MKKIDLYWKNESGEWQYLCTTKDISLTAARNRIYDLPHILKAFAWGCSFENNNREVPEIEAEYQSNGAQN